MSDLDRDIRRDTAGMLRALGVTANPAQMDRYVDTVLTSPGTPEALAAQILRTYGWHPDDDGEPTPAPVPDEDEDLPLAA